MLRKVYKRSRHASKVPKTYFALLTVVLMLVFFCRTYNRDIHERERATARLSLQAEHPSQHCAVANTTGLWLFEKQTHAWLALLCCPLI